MKEKQIYQVIYRSKKKDELDRSGVSPRIMPNSPYFAVFFTDCVNILSAYLEDEYLDVHVFTCPQLKEVSMVDQQVKLKK
jgi:hypothetical protein